MPLIRYKVGDIAIPSLRSCSCGCVWPIVESLEGRIEEMVVTRTGRIIGKLDANFYSTPGIKLAQIINDRKGHIIIRIVKDDDYSSLSLNRMLSQIQKQTHEEMSADFEFVEKICRNKGAKLPLIISKVPFEL